MTITIYDLAGAEADRRFSPFCWRSRMALAHKGLAVETVPWRFTEKDRLPQPNAGRVPVIVDGARVVHDSTAIADYLEERYPDRPSLFGGASGRALTRFVQNWTETVLQTGLIRLVVWKPTRYVIYGGHNHGPLNSVLRISRDWPGTRRAGVAFTYFYSGKTVAGKTVKLPIKVQLSAYDDGVTRF